MDKTNLYVMNKDYCPDDDNIIQQMQCGDCKYYKGFEMSMGQPCIKCSYYSSIQNKETE